MAMKRMRGEDSRLNEARDRLKHLIERERGIKTSATLSGVELMVNLVTKLDGW